jgi:glutamyl-tRNA reductase
MDFFIIGVSHHRAPVSLREKLPPPETLEAALGTGEDRNAGWAESLVLATCNRLEVLGVSGQPETAARAAAEILARAAGLSPEELSPSLHQYYGLSAVRHIFRVSASLDSQVLGEPQILGQVKAAFRESVRRGRAGALLHKLMHRAFRTAKRVRGETSLAGGAVSVAGAAVALARNLWGRDLARARVAVLGAGPMAALAADNLRKRAAADLTIVSRTLAKAEILAAKSGAAARPWTELTAVLAQADLVIAATAAPDPVLTAENLRPLQADRPDRPLYIIDIGVPRNAAHDVKRLKNVVLRNIDDLNETVWESRLSRAEEAAAAEALVEEEVDKFGRWLARQAHQPTLAALARKAETIRRLELKKTLRQHDFSSDQREALEAMTAALVRRLLHDPLVFIKNSSPPGGGCQETQWGCAQRGCVLSIRRAFNI